MEALLLLAYCDSKGAEKINTLVQTLSLKNPYSIKQEDKTVHGVTLDITNYLKVQDAHAEQFRSMGFGKDHVKQAKYLMDNYIPMDPSHQIDYSSRCKNLHYMLPCSLFTDPAFPDGRFAWMRWSAL
jgi:hypothetical protein